MELGENGADLLRLPVEAVTENQGITADPLVDSRVVEMEGQAGGALDSKVLPVHESHPVPGAVTDPLDSMAFPPVIGSRPPGIQRRDPVPVQLDGEAAVDATTAMPKKVTAAWVRGQVEIDTWTKHWKQGGRITPALIVEFHTGLSNGYSLAAICRRVAVTDSTMQDWRKKALAGSEPHGIFNRVVNHALGKSEDFAVDAWISKVPEDWRAAEAFLKARFPEQYGTAARVQVQHEGTVQHEVGVQMIMSDDDLLAIASILQSTGALNVDDGTPTNIIDGEVIE